MKRINRLCMRERTIIHAPESESCAEDLTLHLQSSRCTPRCTGVAINGARMHPCWPWLLSRYIVTARATWPATLHACGITASSLSQSHGSTKRETGVPQVCTSQRNLLPGLRCKDLPPPPTDGTQSCMQCPEAELSMHAGLSAAAGRWPDRAGHTPSRCCVRPCVRPCCCRRSDGRPAGPRTLLLAPLQWRAGCSGPRTLPMGQPVGTGMHAWAPKILVDSCVRICSLAGEFEWVNSGNRRA